MNCFPDTSFLCSIYRQQIFSPRAVALMASLTTSLPVSSLVLFEFRQSVRLQAGLHRQDRTRGFTSVQAQGMLRDLQSDLAGGIVLVSPVDWADVHHIAERLSAIHTEAEGHRFADILHVATALHLGAAEFLTFDEKQKILAESEGMSVTV